VILCTEELIVWTPQGRPSIPSTEDSAECGPVDPGETHTRARILPRTFDDASVVGAMGAGVLACRSLRSSAATRNAARSTHDERTTT